MYKKCKEILEELESQGKLKIWKDFEFPQPVPLKKRLKDVLEKNVDEKYYLSDDKVAKFIRTLDLKSDAKSKVETCFALKKGEEFERFTDTACTLMARDYRGNAVIENIHIDEPVIGASHGRNPENPSDRTTGSPTEQRLEINTNGTSNCLTTVAKDNYVVEPKIQKVEGNLYPNSGDPQVYKSDGISPALDTCSGGNRMPKIIEEPRIEKIGNIYPSGGENGNIYTTCGISPTLKAGQGVTGNGIGSNNAPKIIEAGYYPYPNSDKKHQSNTIYLSDGISPTLDTCSGGNRMPKIIEEPQIRIRKLTPRECWRLQAFRDEDFDKAQKSGISSTQLYKQAGNSICVSVLMALFFNLFRSSVGKVK